MWKISIKYSDKSKCVLTGKHNDIPLNLALHYYKKYSTPLCKVTYQQYPKKEHKSMDLMDKIEELQSEGLIKENNTESYI